MTKRELEDLLYSIHYTFDNKSKPKTIKYLINRGNERFTEIYLPLTTSEDNGRGFVYHELWFLLNRKRKNKIT